MCCYMRDYSMTAKNFHVAIIMDGNGRWAAARGLPRIAGHRRGAEALERTLEAAPGLGVTDLTVYAFSSDNWKRPSDEVNGLMELLRRYLESEVQRCAEKGVRLQVIGRRDRLAPALQTLIESAEKATQHCERIRLRLAIDYCSRDSLLQAAQTCARHSTWSRDAITAALPAPAVDLLIRTGGEQRLSDFLLWEAAYAELLFVDRMWPDFREEDLRHAVTVFQSRQRRFGALPAA
jgi:undecaprenyl diphosphate synthase